MARRSVCQPPHSHHTTWAELCFLCAFFFFLHLLPTDAESVPGCLLPPPSIFLCPSAAAIGLALPRVEFTPLWWLTVRASFVKEQQVTAPRRQHTEPRRLAALARYRRMAAQDGNFCAKACCLHLHSAVPSLSCVLRFGCPSSAALTSSP